MKLIDAHVHLNNTGLVAGASLRPKPKEVAAAAKAAGVGVMLGMPTSYVSDTDPLGIRGALDFAAELKLLKGPTVHPIGFAHPERFDRDHLKLVENVLSEGKVQCWGQNDAAEWLGFSSPDCGPYLLPNGTPTPVTVPCETTPKEVSPLIDATPFTTGTGGAGAMPKGTASR